ncbi:MAG: ABC transporter ATP-binding protein [Nibricoccus sp.]
MKTSAIASPLVVQNLSKSYKKVTALRDVSFEIPEGRVVGLLGRNGAGKTTLLDLACGLLLPTAGEIHTLGRSARELDSPELTQLGVVRQEGRFIEWMTVAQQLDFTASFYPAWDAALEKRLLQELELNPSRKIVQLSQGDQQKLSIVLGVCHHPKLILLDEPMSALDPIIRTRFLDLVLERLRDDGCTAIISSHLLGDVEKVIDWVVCLDAGELAVSSPFDELQESYAEWIVSAPAGGLPSRFSESYVLSAEGDARQARIRVQVDDAEDALARFTASYRAEVKRRSLSLDEMFPLLTQRRQGRNGR